jgi:hypothetical protein
MKPTTGANFGQALKEYERGVRVQVVSVKSEAGRKAMHAVREKL